MDKPNLATDPYLGRLPLHALDLLIPALCAVNQEAANWTKTHESGMSELQNACCYIIPNAVQISLSIRELIRSGYLFSAKILIRSLVERVLVISVFQKKPEKIEKWLKTKGTNNKPSYAEMLESIEEFKRFSEIEGVDMITLIKGYIDDLHSVVHVDVLGLHQNTLLTSEGELRYLSGADHNNPLLADEVCQQTLIFITLLMSRIAQIFPEISARRAD